MNDTRLAMLQQSARRDGNAQARTILSKGLPPTTLARLVEGQRGVIDQHRTLVGPQGQPLQPATPARRAQDVAYAEAFVETIEGAL